MPRAKVSFTPVLPKGKFDIQVYINAWEDTMRQKVKPELKILFSRTVSGWDNKPSFRGTINKSTEFLRLLVKPVGRNAPLYAMIDITGAKPHMITPRTADRLTYRTGYTASTRPGILKSRRKRRSGPLVSAQVVRHPGFAPRDFSETIAKTYQKTYVRHMTRATERATLTMGKTF